jgi:hypothetical protein
MRLALKNLRLVFLGVNTKRRHTVPSSWSDATLGQLTPVDVRIASGNKLCPIDGALDTARSPVGTSMVLFPKVRLVGPSK